MDISLKYGKQEIVMDLDSFQHADVLSFSESKTLVEPEKQVYQALEKPIGTPSLHDLVQLKSPENVVIIVNDITRPTPNSLLLPPILKILNDAGVSAPKISFVIATGIHEPHTHEQNIEIFGKELVEAYEFVSHNCDDENLVFLGDLSSGNPLYVNKKVAEADLVLSIGVILPHYFAGYSGGRKSLVPGVAGRETIERNHSRMVELVDNLPELRANPLSLEMIEGAKRAGLDFIVNVVVSPDGDIVGVVAGDVEKAWYEGVRISSNLYEVPIEHLYDVVIVSAGGYPRDINVYQAQKAIDHADRATKENGTIIVLSECSGGLGEKTFRSWLEKAKTPLDIISRIQNEFVLGGHKAFGIAKVAYKKKIVMITSLDEATASVMFAKKSISIEDSISNINREYGEKYSCLIIPDGNVTVPVLQRLEVKK